MLLEMDSQLTVIPAHSKAKRRVDISRTVLWNRTG
jgi:hypothetical protein